MDILNYNKSDGDKNASNSLIREDKYLLAKLEVDCEKWMRFKRQNRFYLKFTKENIEDLFKEFPQALAHPCVFTSSIHTSKDRTNELIEFIVKLDAEHGM